MEVFLREIAIFDCFLVGDYLTGDWFPEEILDVTASLDLFLFLLDGDGDSCKED